MINQLIVREGVDMNNDKISILMATYNGETYLREQLDSIISQTYQTLEILIQDDNSSDNTYAILEEYANKDPRIIIHQNEQNLGIVDNFYDIIDKSTGEYIAISDQDDVWHLEKIEILAKHIGEHSLIYTDSALIDGEGADRGVTILEYLGFSPQEGRCLNYLFEYSTISGHACLFSKNIKSKIPYRKKDSVYHNDPLIMYDMVVATIASYAKGVVYYDTPLTYHRIHELNNNNKLEGLNAEYTNREISNIKPTNYFLRKKSRVQGKIKKKIKALHRTKQLFESFSSKEENPFRAIICPIYLFSCLFFNIFLYKKLKSYGVHQSEAFELSKGKLWIATFEFF